MFEGDTMMMKPVYVKANTVLKLGQRIEVSLSYYERPYFSRLEDITESSLVLAMPMDEQQRPLFMTPGTKICCRAFGEQCYYLFEVEFHNGGEDNIPVCFVSKPDEVEKIQYRDFVRIKTSQALVVRPVNEEGVREPMIITSTIDMSGAGLCFSLYRPLAVGSQVAVEVNEIPGVGLATFMSRVIRCSEVDVRGEKVYQIGVKFLNINRTIQNKLINYIFELQRQALAKGVDGDFL